MLGNLEGLITSDAAQEMTGYTVDHLRRLARTGVVQAILVGRQWFFDPDSLRQHQEVAKPGPRPGTRRNVPVEVADK